MKNLMYTFAFFLISFQLHAKYYCLPAYSGTYNYIRNFTLHTLEHLNSYKPLLGYTNYSDSGLTTQMNIAKRYPISISDERPSGTYGKFGVWIDFDNDTLFEANERVYYDSINLHVSTGFIQIPNDNAIVGFRRMRVSYAWYPNSLYPCGSYNQGETQDYTIEITSGQKDSITYSHPFPLKTTQGFFIDTFRLSWLINNGSNYPQGAYTLYSKQQFNVDLALGNSYPVYISKDVQAGISGEFSIWIDLNNDGDFELSERLLYENAVYKTNSTILIPNNNSYIGWRRMRVRAEWNDGWAYTAYGFSQNGEVEDYWVNIVSTPSSVPHLSKPLKLHLFPNPSSGSFQIKSDQTILKVQIIDSKGSLIQSHLNIGNEINLEIATKGLYFVRVETPSGVETKPVLISN